MDRGSNGGADDVVDALERIAPAFGESSAAGQVRAALTLLLQDALRNEVAASRNDAQALTLALDHLEAVGGPSLGAEIDAIRLVADARK